jgi:hypothetical protein
MRRAAAAGQSGGRGSAAWQSAAGATLGAGDAAQIDMTAADQNLVRAASGARHVGSSVVIAPKLNSADVGC